MIRVRRRMPEPPALGPKRTAGLAGLNAAFQASGLHPGQTQIGTTYKVVKGELWEDQHYKCAYCELTMQAAFQTVEHYRPKAAAIRAPGSAATYGYWWMAWDWDNLLFICGPCNSAKGTQFPLAPGSVALAPGQVPKGAEKPQLLDPSRSDPSRHIEFVPIKGQWVAQGRTPRGQKTVDALHLATRHEIRTLWSEYVDRVVAGAVKNIRDAIRSGDQKQVLRAWNRARRILTNKRAMFSSLARGVLAKRFSKKIRKRWNLPDP